MCIFCIRLNKLFIPYFEKSFYFFPYTTKKTVLCVQKTKKLTESGQIYSTLISIYIFPANNVQKFEKCL